MLAAYSSPYPQSRFLDEDDNYKPIVQPQIHVNDLPPPRVVHNRPDTRNFFIVAVRKSDDVGHIRVYPRWNGFDWADRKLVVHTLRPWRSQALGRLFKDYYGAEVVWQDKHSGRIV